MTAQVAVMNKTAVALATDSAVTSRHKIYNSVNKLFRLSDHHPIGVMIYGNAEFMGIPWESIIKLYRSKLGTKLEKTLLAYGDSFVKHLTEEPTIFPDSEREGYVARITYGILSDLIEEIQEIRNKNPSDLDAAILSHIKTNYFDAICTHFKELDNLPADFRTQLITKYEKSIIEAINEAISEIGITISAATEEIIKNHCIEFLCRQYFDDCSGIVIAGFGDDEIFPALVEYEVEGMAIGNFLKYRKKREASIRFDNSANINPFAQKEMVQSFMEGIHPLLYAHFSSYLKNVFDKYEQEIIKNLSGATGIDMVDFQNKLQKSGKAIFSELTKELKRDQRENHIQPVLDVVEILPKDELASMAESLVNLTILKRRMSTDQETVGGPIDVAVISKGDGFIWIKRKHYFEKELNPRYLMQYSQAQPTEP